MENLTSNEKQFLETFSTLDEQGKQQVLDFMILLFSCPGFRAEFYESKQRADQGGEEYRLFEETMELVSKWKATENTLKKLPIAV